MLVERWAKSVACEVSPAPQVEVQKAGAIDVFSDVLKRLPNGETPLIAGIESFANDPGRLAADEVSGALIVLSDGGDACAEGDLAQKVAFAGEATRKLHERGIDL